MEINELITQLTGFLNQIQTNGFNYLIQYYPRPSSIFQCAGIDTLVFILLVISFGLMVNLLTQIIFYVLAKILGGKFTLLLVNYLTWPGVVHHELSHALVAFLSGAKVEKIVVFPKGETLGHVDFIPRGNIFFRSIQISLSSIAPPALGIISIFLISKFTLPLCKIWWNYLLAYYVLVSIAMHMRLSKADCKNFFIGLFPSAFIIYLIMLAVEKYCCF